MGRTSTARDRLVHAMADLVHRKGYTAVGVDEVCRTAGVRKGSFYHFFKSKRELMAAAMDYRWQMVCDHFLPAAFSAEVPPVDRIVRMFAAVAEAEARNLRSGGAVLGCPFGNIVAEVGASEPLLTGKADTALCGFAALVRDALHEAQACGEIDSEIDVAEAAEATVAYFEGLAVLAKARNDPSIIRRLGPRVVQLAGRSAPRSGARPKRRRMSAR